MREGGGERKESEGERKRKGKRRELEQGGGYISNSLHKCFCLSW